MIFWNANEPFALSAIVVLIGYLLKRLGVFKERDGEVLAKVALNVTLPAVVLLNLPSIEISGSNLLLPVFGLVSSMLMALIGTLIFRHRGPLDRGLSVTSSAGYNIGLFAIPIVTGLYGTGGIARFALFDVGNAFAIFGLSWILAWRYSPLNNAGDGAGFRTVVKMLFSSVPFVVYLLAILLNLAGLRPGGFIVRILEIPAAMNRGISMLTLGVLLRFKFSNKTWKTIIPPLLLRYIFGTVAGGLVLFFLPVSIEYRISIAGALVMPVGLTVIPYAVRWGYDRDRAAALLNIGIPVSFGLFWLVWAAGNFLQILQP